MGRPVNVGELHRLMAAAMHTFDPERSDAEAEIRADLKAMLADGTLQCLDPSTLAAQDHPNADELHSCVVATDAIQPMLARLGIELQLLEQFDGPRFWTIGNAARSISIQEGLDGHACAALRNQMMAAAVEGKLEVLDPNRHQLFRPTESKDWYDLVTLGRVNAWLAESKASYRWGAPLVFPVSKSLEPWFKCTLSEMPEAIRVTLRSELLYFNWDNQKDQKEESRRRSWAEAYDADNDPAPEHRAQMLKGWHDQGLGADHWFSLKDVGPDRAAMRLCQLDPNQMTLEQATGHKNEATGPDEFVRLLQRFEDLAKCQPQHRTLLHWLEFARASGLRYHPWIDEYVKAAKLQAPTPSGAVMPAELVPEPEESLPLDDYSALATRKELIAAFGVFTGMSMAWFKNLKDTPALFKARKVDGVGARSSTREPLFCPMEVALWLMNAKRKKGRPFHNAAKPWELLESHFPAAYARHSAGDPREERPG